MFYASMSIIAAAVLGLGVGAYVGIRLWNRFVQSFDKAMSLDKYKNTAGAVWLGHTVREKLRDGATTKELSQWLDEVGDEMKLRGKEMGPDILDAWRSTRED